MKQPVSALRDDAELLFPGVRIPDPFADPDDEMLGECAVAGEADFIVSGHKAHVQAVVSIRGIPILSPARFLKLLRAKGT